MIRDFADLERHAPQSADVAAQVTAATGACPRPEPLWPPRRCALPPRRPHGRPRSRSPARTARAPRCAASGASNVPAKSASLPAPGSPRGLPLTPIPHEPSAQPPQTMPARNPRAASEPQRSPPGFVSTSRCRLPAPSEVARQTAHGRLPPRNPTYHSARGALPPGAIQATPPTSPIRFLQV